MSDPADVKRATPRKYGNIFASQFLEKVEPWVLPDGHYDGARQRYVRDDNDEPAFTHDGLYATRGGNEITTNPSTNVSGLVVTDTDNG
jgi:hypothetical protein